MERVFPVVVLGLMAVAFLSACVECAERHSLREGGLLFYARVQGGEATAIGLPAGELERKSCG